MKKITFSASFGILFILISATTLSGCSLLPQSNTTEKDSQTLQEESAPRDTTLSGSLQSSGGKYFLKTAQKTVELDSYSVEFAEYVGKTVSVTGQYSGDTLFAESITQE